MLLPVPTKKGSTGPSWLPRHIVDDRPKMTAPLMLTVIVLIANADQPNDKLLEPPAIHACI